MAIPKRLIPLAAPFYLLHWGRYLQLVYTGTVLLVTWQGYSIAHHALLEFIPLFASSSALAYSIAPYLYEFVQAVFLLVSSAGVIVAIVLPVRVQYLQRGKLKFSQLLFETPSAFVGCARSLVYLFQRELRTLFPLAVLIGLYFYSTTAEGLAQMKYFYLAGSVILCLSVFKRTLSIVLTPIVAVVGRYDPESVTDATIRIVEGALLKVIALVGGAILSIVVSLWLSFQLGLNEEARIAMQIGVMTFLFWYFLTLTGALCIKLINGKGNIFVEIVSSASEIEVVSPV
ncbi:MAG: hypothetical protein KDD70_05435 [Bdellovibrionales bacterium]|nr:hypothetical protein [Bdellovibrionales bacterium]